MDRMLGLELLIGEFGGGGVGWLGYYDLGPLFLPLYG
jgi:hypothetical protein